MFYNRNSTIFEHWCENCKRPLGNISFWSDGGSICHLCEGKKKKANRKHKGIGSTPQHSKPLHPKRYGYSFRPDKMPPNGEKFLESNYSNKRYKWNDRQAERQYRKRQRRVNIFFIEEQLRDG